MDNNDLMSLQEVAERMRMRPGAIYAARRRGAFPPAARIGGKLLWRRSDIEAHIRELLVADEREMAEHRWRHRASL